MEAELLTEWGEAIGRCVKDIAGQFPKPNSSTAAATAFIARIGNEIPDSTIKAAVKRLATVRFRIAGVEV